MEPIEAWGTLSRRFGYFYGSSVALEMGFGGSHRLQTDFSRQSKTHPRTSQEHGKGQAECGE